MSGQRNTGSEGSAAEPGFAFDADSSSTLWLISGVDRPGRLVERAGGSSVRRLCEPVRRATRGGVDAAFHRRDNPLDKRVLERFSHRRIVCRMTKMASIARSDAVGLLVVAIRTEVSRLV